MPSTSSLLSTLSDLGAQIAELHHQRLVFYGMSGSGIEHQFCARQPCDGGIGCASRRHRKQTLGQTDHLSQAGFARPEAKHVFVAGMKLRSAGEELPHRVER